MIRTLSITPQPTARETRDILFRLGHDLTTLGARVDHGIPGGFRFHMPLLWNSRAAGFLRAVSSGRVTIGAALGEPWRVRYELRFSMLWFLTLALTAALVIFGFHWHRAFLLDLIVVLWLVAYGIPYVAASRAFQKRVAEAIHHPLDHPFNSPINSPVSTPYMHYSMSPPNGPAPSA